MEANCGDAVTWIVRADESRRRRGWIFGEDESRRRRGRDVDSPWRRVSGRPRLDIPWRRVPAPRPQREYSVKTGARLRYGLGTYWLGFDRAKICGEGSPCTRTKQADAMKHYPIGPPYVLRRAAR